MKKFLPFIFLGVGLVVLIGVIIMLKGKGKETQEEETAPEIPFEMRPVTSLTPTEDGHWLEMAIDKIGIEAETLDYQLLYNLPDGRSQGVPGTVKIQKGIVIERKLLLGTESSGRFYYDSGVSEGTLTLKFRDAKGKLVGKLTTNFKLLSASDELVSQNGLFKYILEDKPKKGFFIVMETFGVYKPLDTAVSMGPIGIFSSIEGAVPGKVQMEGEIYHFEDEKWKKLEGGESSNIGIFVSSIPQ